MAARLSHDNDLRAGLRLGLEQHRIHPDIGTQPAGPCLKRLGAPHLLPFISDGGIQRHVLGLERRDVQPTPGEKAAQARGEQTFAGIGRCAQHHDRRGKPDLFEQTAGQRDNGGKGGFRHDILLA